MRYRSWSHRGLPFPYLLAYRVVCLYAVRKYPENTLFGIAHLIVFHMSEHTPSVCERQHRSNRLTANRYEIPSSVSPIFLASIFWRWPRKKKVPKLATHSYFIIIATTTSTPSWRLSSSDNEFFIISMLKVKSCSNRRPCENFDSRNIKWKWNEAKNQQRANNARSKAKERVANTQPWMYERRMLGRGGGGGIGREEKIDLQFFFLDISVKWFHGNGSRDRIGVSVAVESLTRKLYKVIRHQSYNQ